MRPQMQTRKVELSVEDPEHAASKRNDVEYSALESQVIGPESKSPIDFYTNTSGEPRYVRAVSFGVKGEYNDEIFVDLVKFDDNDVAQWEMYGNADAFPMQFSPPLNLPDGYWLRMSVHNPTTATLDCYVSGIHYGEQPD